MSDDIKPEKDKRKITLAELDAIKNYIILDISYDTSLCFPYKEGIALLAALENAERCKIEGYSDIKVSFITTPLNIATHIITQRSYREQKMNMLLGVDND